MCIGETIFNIPTKYTYFHLIWTRIYGRRDVQTLSPMFIRPSIATHLLGITLWTMIAGWADYENFKSAFVCDINHYKGNQSIRKIISAPLSITYLHLK